MFDILWPYGLLWWLRWQRIHLQCKRPGFDLWIGKIPWRRAWQPTPVFLPGESLWTEEPGGLQSRESQRVRNNWVTKHITWTLACQDPLSIGFSRQVYWNGLPCPSPGDLSHPGIKPASLSLLHWQASSLPFAPLNYFYPIYVKNSSNTTIRKII